MPNAAPNFEPPVVPVIVAGMPGCESAALLFAKQLRKAGIACTTDIAPGKFKRKMELAGKARVYYVAILGSDEVSTGKVTLRDMDDRTSETLPVSDGIAKLGEMLLTSEERQIMAATRQTIESLR